MEVTGWYVMIDDTYYRCKMIGKEWYYLCNDKTIPLPKEVTIDQSQ